ncbi:hypothetical protein D3260_06525 [Salinisphaera sp. Q1T1-3]|nr:hypothetical protein D3260_06525 [Salinisphaera sp. Q1T1-3]
MGMAKDVKKPTTAQLITAPCLHRSMMHVASIAPRPAATAVFFTRALGKYVDNSWEDAAKPVKTGVSNPMVIF